MQSIQTDLVFNCFAEEQNQMYSCSPKLGLGPVCRIYGQYKLYFNKAMKTIYNKQNVDFSFRFENT